MLARPDTSDLDWKKSITGGECQLDAAENWLHSIHSKIEEFAIYLTLEYLGASVKVSLNGNRLLHAGSQEINRHKNCYTPHQ